MSEQLVLDLQFRPALGREDFLVSACNAAAVALVDAWPGWPASAVALVGPPGSGKTHLAHVFRARAGARALSPGELCVGDPLSFFPEAGAAVVLEDADRLLAGDKRREAALFHLLNAAAQRGGWILLSATLAAARWPVTLPDLRSRTNALTSARLDEPDDALLTAVVFKQFSDRGLRVSPGALAYLVARMDRSFAAVKDVVERADKLALQEGRAVTVPLLKRVLTGDVASAPSPLGGAGSSLGEA